MNILIVIIIALFKINSMAFQIIPETENDKIIVQEILQILENNRDKIPPQLLSLPEILVGSIDTNEYKNISNFDPLCDDKNKIKYGDSNSILGYLNETGINNIKHHIKLNPNLVSKKYTGKCNEQQRHQLLQRTFLHELSHVYDNYIQSGSPLFEQKKSIQHLCISSLNDQPYNCLRKKNVSDDLQFLLLSDFRPLIEEKSIEFGNTEIKYDHLSFERLNIYTNRSPRSYEDLNPSEYFAVNMEYFIFDPEYKCRRPGTYLYLQNHFNFDAWPEVKCNKELPVVVANGKTLNINPDRIYQIHYMITEPGHEIQSLWGHAILRFVICAPERTQISSECLRDTKYHIVVDFAAQLFNEGLSLIGGLVGKYPNGANFYKFEELRKDSLDINNRDIKSIPLNLSRSEIIFLTNLIVEKSWNKLTKYLFLTNNCSHQILYTILGSLRRDSITNNLLTVKSILKSNFLTPSQVELFIHKSGLAVNGYEPEENVTYFISLEKKLANRMSKYADKLVLKDFLSLSAKTRMAYYHTKSLSFKDMTEANDYQMSFLEIEQLVIFQIQSKIKDIFIKVENKLKENQKLTPLNFKNSFSITNPNWNGYGIPIDFNETYSLINNSYTLELQTYVNSVISEYSDKDKKQALQLSEQQTESTNNIIFILKIMNKNR